MSENAVLPLEHAVALSPSLAVVWVFVSGVCAAQVSYLGNTLLAIEQLRGHVLGIDRARVDVGLACDDVIFHAAAVHQGLALKARNRHISYLRSSTLRNLRSLRSWHSSVFMRLGSDRISLDSLHLIIVGHVVKGHPGD